MQHVLNYRGLNLKMLHPHILNHFQKLYLRYTRKIDLKRIGFLILFHLLSSFIAYRALGEPVAESFINFVYYEIVTISTVGYGDYSPETDIGKLFTSFYHIPFGLVIFSLLISKLIERAFKRADDINKGNISMSDQLTTNESHVLIFGSTNHTADLFEHIKNEDSEIELVLVSDIVDETKRSDLPKHHYINVKDFADSSTIDRTELLKAKHVIIDTGSDEKNLTIALLVQREISMHKLDLRAIVYFDKKSTEHLVEASCPNIESITMQKNALLSREVLTPGSTKIIEEINSKELGTVSQYSATIKLKCPTVIEPPTQFFREWGQIKQTLESNFEITLIAYKERDSKSPVLNPHHGSKLTSGCTVFYLATKPVAESFEMHAQ
ncbi:TPA: two pore domain potassium channel family protein [Vibrio vulnificus]|uniref:Two pore domain potassium channel family protein n=1 Tax=Vibrio vulnificus TaxID=672 RepID=A0A8H9K5B9_VIBVL|nr:two pore domain potassium channel family protein [Vibrio vulnificus]